MPTLHYCIRHTKVSDEIKDDEYVGGAYTLTQDEVERAFKKKAGGNYRQLFDESVETLGYSFRNYERLDEEALENVQLCVGVVLYAVQQGVSGEKLAGEEIVIMDQADVGGEVDIYEMPSQTGD